MKVLLKLPIVAVRMLSSVWRSANSWECVKVFEVLPGPPRLGFV